MNTMQQTFHCNTPEDTAEWGRILGANLRAGDVIALVGDLGAGKTTLTQAIAQGMGIADDVTSPTFTLVQEYDGRVPLFHFDVYRIDADALLDIGFEDYFARGGVVLIEWADKILSLLPAENLTLELSIMDNDAEPTDEMELPRRLEATASGTRFITLLEELCSVPELAAMKENTP